MDSIQNETEEFFSGLYKELNKSPFDVDEIFDRSFYGKVNSITVLMFNGYLTTIKSNISAESFKKELERWLKLESIHFNANILQLVFSKLVHLAASYQKSEGKKEKKSLLRIRDRFRDEKRKIENEIKKFPQFQLKDDALLELMKQERFIMNVTGKGKNPRFLLQETLTIYAIKKITGFSFESICYLVAKTYEFFNFFPPDTNAINYAHSLKVNIYQFIKRKKNHIYKLIEIDKEIYKEQYYNHKKVVDEMIDWLQSIIK